MHGPHVPCAVCDPDDPMCNGSSSTHITSTDGSVSRWKNANECFGRQLPYGTPICRYAVNKLRRFQYRDSSVRPIMKFTMQVIANVPLDVNCKLRVEEKGTKNMLDFTAYVRANDVFRFRIPGELKASIGQIFFIRGTEEIACYQERIFLDTDNRAKLINITIDPAKVHVLDGTNFECGMAQQPIMFGQQPQQLPMAQIQNATSRFNGMFPQGAPPGMAMGFPGMMDPNMLMQMQMQMAGQQMEMMKAAGMDVDQSPPDLPPPIHAMAMGMGPMAMRPGTHIGFLPARRGDSTGVTDDISDISSSETSASKSGPTESLVIRRDTSSSGSSSPGKMDGLFLDHLLQKPGSIMKQYETAALPKMGM